MIAVLEHSEADYMQIEHQNDKKFHKFPRLVLSEMVRDN